jgi:APA family basic amino acid/polyamine antiporter
VLLFYILTVAGVFVLRHKQPELARPYKVFAYPLVPAIYIILAITICVSLLIYKPDYSLSGLGIVLLGVPVFYFMQSKSA